MSNLTLLPCLNDSDIVSNLRARWDQGNGWTPAGDRAMIAIQSLKQASPDRSAVDFAASIYKQMVRSQKDQALFVAYVLSSFVHARVSGEAGSGKSSNLNGILKELIRISQSSPKKSKVHSGALKIPTILSAFGSASIDTHSHASRVLIYQELQFQESGDLIGIKTLDYGLDKDRVAHVIPGEANFDVFYMMLVGASREEKTAWHLQDHSHYAYLSGSSLYPPVYEQDFKTLRQCLKSVGIGTRNQIQLFKLLSAILHLGNIVFHDDSENRQESCSIKNRDLLEQIAELLGVSGSHLEFVLTYQSKIIQNELCTVFLSIEEAVFFKFAEHLILAKISQRDAIAKSLYSLVFSWIVEHLNSKYCLDDCDTYLGLVDMPGFRNSKKGNGLEQFLFNYANEKVRAFTNIRFWNAFQVHGFEEGIVTEEGASTDNSIVELISSSSTGIVSVIDAETARALKKGVDSTANIRFVDRLNDRFSKTPNFKSAKAVKKKSVVISTLFTITHFSDLAVEYDIQGFVDKNSDMLPPDLVSLFRGNDEMPPSSSKFIRNLFSDEVVSTQVLERNKDIVTSAQITPNPTRQPSTKKKRKGSQKNAQEETEVHVNEMPTLSTKFVNSVDELCNALTDAETWILICLSHHPPNKNDKTWDSSIVRRQIAFHGVTSLSQYQVQCPYPNSYRFSVFIEKFKSFFKAGENPALAVLDPLQVCKDFAHEFEWGRREVMMGNTEIFLSQTTFDRLHERLERNSKRTFGYRSVSGR